MHRHKAGRGRRNGVVGLPAEAAHAHALWQDPCNCVLSIPGQRALRIPPLPRYWQIMGPKQQLGRLRHRRSWRPRHRRSVALTQDNGVGEIDRPPGLLIERQSIRRRWMSPGRGRGAWLLVLLSSAAVMVFLYAINHDDSRHLTISGRSPVFTNYRSQITSSLSRW
jgi:hypothetical protein